MFKRRVEPNSRAGKYLTHTVVLAFEAHGWGEAAASSSSHKLGGLQKSARRLRNLWQLPQGPVRSVIGSIESAGGIVFRCSFGTTKVDGISQWSLADSEASPVFFVSDRAPGDRERWTLAHEIAHVVMHHLPTDDPEPEADRFAAEFMMPAHEIERDLRNGDLPPPALEELLEGVDGGNSEQDGWVRFPRTSTNTCSSRWASLVIACASRFQSRQKSQNYFRKWFPSIWRASGKAIKEVSEYLGIYEDEFKSQYLKNLAGIKLVG